MVGRENKEAQRRIRKPGNRFWAPMKKLNVNNRYKLRKKIIKVGNGEDGKSQ